MKILFICISLLVCFNLYSAELVEVESLRIGLDSQVVQVTTVATALPITALSGRKVITIQNLTSTDIFLGDSSITAGTGSGGGLQLRNAGDIISLDMTENIILYGIITSGSSPCAILEVR